MSAPIFKKKMKSQLPSELMLEEDWSDPATEEYWELLHSIV
jgi:hypothetical protein